MPMVIGRWVRDAKAMLAYPYWAATGRAPPDNHVAKRRRILAIQERYACETFLETGTFYGQMVNAVRRRFSRVISIELFEPLYELNRRAFAGNPNVTVIHGDSSRKLEQAIGLAQGRILYWLDGHYSGGGTGMGDDVSPILRELETIRKCGRRTDCILIDDARLFTGADGYPTLESTREAIARIGADYEVRVDGDCILAVPRSA